MKKTFKRAGVAVLSMAMLLSMGAVGAMSANAYTGTNGDLRIVSTATTIKAYKVAAFTRGAWAWDSNAKSVTSSDMTNLTGGTSTAEERKTLADKLAADVSDLAAIDLSASTSEEDSGHLNDLAPGYYLIISSGAGKMYQNKLIEVKSQKVVTLSDDKSTSIGVTKTITSVSDGGVIAGSSGKAATASDGATVTYSIQADVPTYSSEATTSSMHDYVLVDDYDDTFTDISVNSVTIGSDTLDKVATESGIVGDINAGKYYLDTSDIEENNKGFTIKVNKKSVLTHGGQKVTVTFTAKLNADNRTDYKYPNEVTFKYDNTFNATGGEGIGSDEADTYSIPLEIYKYAMLGTPATKTPITTDDAVFKLNDGVNDYSSTAVSGTGYYTFKSLKAGTYTLTEDESPAGYQSISGTIATITISVGTNGTVSVKDASNNDLTKNSNYYVTEVENIPQQSLPGTGGMGTVLFTVGGAAIVLAAGAMFVVYMRKRKNEEQ